MSDSWTIQMGDGSKPVRIGKFDDSVNLAQAAPPVRMWEELEPLIEDDPAHEEEKRPQDFRKNRRRHAFKRKSTARCGFVLWAWKRMMWLLWLWFWVGLQRG